MENKQINNQQILMIQSDKITIEQEMRNDSIKINICYIVSLKKKVIKIQFSALTNALQSLLS